MNSFFRHFISPSSREFSSLHITSDLHRYIYLYKYIRHMDVAPGETRVGREAVVVLPLSSNYRPVFPASEKSGRSRIISDLISELFETKGKEQKRTSKEVKREDRGGGDGGPLLGLNSVARRKGRRWNSSGRITAARHTRVSGGAHYYI